MRTEYRKKPPYYRKYKYKIELELSPNGGKAKGYKSLVHDMFVFFNKNIGSTNYRQSSGWCYWIQIYLTNDDSLNMVLGSDYRKYLKCLWRPAPGFENINSEKVSKPGKNALWYGRYPYKIIIKIESGTTELHEAEYWCLENCFSDHRKSGYSNSVRFFFINPIDATGFKLRFSDQIVNTEMPTDKIAEQLLRNRIKEAKIDLNDFLEGGSS